MCGLSGFFGFDQYSREQVQFLGAKMAGALYHRGPDANGCWIDADAEICLSHQRLAIIDISEAGAQPMASRTGRFVTVFNGEIYNHKDLRIELMSADKDCADWQGTSDTETFLAALEQWGFDVAIKRLVGMFSLAVWDRATQKLYLARDRMGEKPIYYGWQNGVFLFASELKALKCHPAFEGQINRQAVSLQMQYSYIPDPYSIYTNIYKLNPGHYIALNATELAGAHEPISSKSYWSYNDALQKGISEPFSGSDEQAVEELENLLKASVERQMEADVPIGAFLSGGIDSTCVTAIMQSLAKSPVKTFTIGFDDPQFNEAEYAREISKHLGTDHTELYVSPREVLDVIPKLPHIYDEPFSDASQIPTFLVSQMTRQNVTVALSGDGGDELFFGYERYRRCSNYWNNMGFIPYSLRSFIGRKIVDLSDNHYNVAVGLGATILPKLRRFRRKRQRIAQMLQTGNHSEFYNIIISHWLPSENFMIDQLALADTAKKADELSSLNLSEDMMRYDVLNYLPGDILVKVDRAAMAHSLETRVPFLDHNIVEFSCRLPLHMKMQNNSQKWIVRQVLKKHVPEYLTDRPKKGFGVPMGAWLRGPLRDWAEDLLDEKRLRDEGFFDPKVIRNKLYEHMSGVSDWSSHLWDVLSFQAWLERND